MSQQSEIDCFLTWKTCIWHPVEEIEQDQDEEDIEDFVSFSIKSLEGFAILDGGATKTVSGFLSVQPVADRYEETTIETTVSPAAKRRQRIRNSAYHMLRSHKESR